MSEPANRGKSQSAEMLVARGIRKVYRQGEDSLEVLKGISLSVAPGEYLMIVGPSGAGKSTLLHILGLLDRPTEGDLWLEGRCLTCLPASTQAQIRNRLFGFVFQFFHLLPDFTAIENVMLPAMVGTNILAWSRRKAQVREAAEALLRRVGLADRMHHRPSQLSGGERQRVAICRALINRPRVLLLDEPTGNLDSRTGRQILDLVQSLNREDGLTIIMVTHDPEVANPSGRIIRLRDGQIVRS